MTNTLFVGRAEAAIHRGQEPYVQPRRPPVPLHSRPAVLVVDDEETPRSVTCRMVRGLGYPTHTARDGREALRYIQQHPGEIRLVLTDMIMPYMDGGELSERVRDLHLVCPSS